MKPRLERIFERTIERLSLDRVIAGRLACRDDALTIDDERIDLARYSRILTVAFGKAAVPMLEATARVLAPRPVTGVVCGPGAPGVARRGLAAYEGGHPYPDHDSFRAATATLALLDGAGPDDLVLYLLSGGGSSICEGALVPEISEADYRELYRLLVTSGLPVLEVNYLRKHLSAVKGGRLTARAWPARQLTLYVSDAPPGHPSNVASGPTMPDESTVDDCRRIVRRAGLLPRLPDPVRRLLESGRLPETPTPGARIFDRSSWHCLLDPDAAVEALAAEARAERWIVEIDLSVQDDWPLARTADHLLGRLERLRRWYPARTVALANRGEYSCPVTGAGLGGRNQALVLDMVSRIADRRIAVLSAGTDGMDGTSPAAGAVADGSTLARAAALGLDPCDFARRADSYRFFTRLGDAIVTGPTGNNVRDVRLLVAEPAPAAMYAMPPQPSLARSSSMR